MKSKLNIPTIAYFSMEIALDPAIPTYSGGLGMLAGDTLRSAADIGAPLIAVTLVYREGYFRQRLDSFGSQSEEPQHWDPERVVQPVDGRVTIEIEKRPVVVRAWKYTVQGITGDSIPVYLLDTNLPENAPEDRCLDQLPLRRRPALPPMSGSRPRTGRHEDPEQGRLHQHSGLSHERGPLIAAGTRPARTPARPKLCRTREDSRHRQRSPPLHLYDPHARSSRTRRISPPARRTGARRGAHEITR